MTPPEPDSDALDESRLRQLIDVGRSLVAELDPETILRRVLEVACELTGARYAALGVLDPERRRLERFITHGIDEKTREAIGELPRGHGVLGLLIEQPQPLRLADVGAHPRSYGFPAGHPPMQGFLGVPIVIRGQAWGNLYLTEKEGGEFDQADEQSALILAEWTAIAVENARLYQSAETQRDELSNAVRRLEATNEIARVIGGETDLDRILETIVKRGRALVDAKGMLILLRDGAELVVVAAAGEFHRDLVGTRIEVSGSISGHVMQTRRAERMTDVGNQLHFALSKYVDVRTGLFVPLSYRSETLGVLNAFDRGGGEEFRKDDQQLLEGFAASAATAVATAQSVAEHRLHDSLEATERERGRWARELHDEALQSMAGLRVLLSTARRADSAEIDSLLSRGLDQVDNAIAEMRRLIADLRPPTLDELGLATAIVGLAEKLAETEGIEVEVHANLACESGRHPTRLVAPLENTIYRLVQEALHNAARHGGADSARVTLEEGENEIEVRIEDGGRGFDPEQSSDGFGLLGMRERVALAKGDLKVISAPDMGTQIVATLPARHRPEDAAEAELARRRAANDR
jgi:two-component system, NarL family, sensor histidine kinase DevS